jgi:hypothetical protein
MRYLLCFYIVLGLAVTRIPNPDQRTTLFAAIGAMILIIHSIQQRHALKKAGDYALSELLSRISRAKSDQN